MSETLDIKSKLSWWEYDFLLRKVDYTIVGSGIVGISTALEIKALNPKASILVLDKKSTPFSASTKNAGFACFGSISEIIEDASIYGEDICQKLIRMRWKGLTLLKNRLSNLEMNYRNQSGSEIFNSEEEVSYYNSKIQWANSFVEEAIGEKDCFECQKGLFGAEIRNRLEGSLNPMLMMNSLESKAKKLGVKFLSGVEIEEISIINKTLQTNLGMLEFEKLVVCTNGFSKSLFPSLSIDPARNQVIITEPIKDFNLGSCYHMNQGYVYFREIENRLLIGGGRQLNKVGEMTTDFGTTEQIINYLLNIVRERILPNRDFEIAHTWSGILGVGDSKMPIVKKIDDDILVAIRMGGMGVAIGSLIGKLSAAIIVGVDNRDELSFVN